MNLCIFTGRLTRDPESRTIPTGKTVVSFAIAINEGKDKVIYVDLEAWEATGEFITQYFTKGKPITVQSRLQMDRWEDKSDGSARSKAKFVVSKVDFVPGNTNKPADDEQVETENVPVEAEKPTKKVGRPKAPKPVEVDEESDDEIPF